MAKFTTYIIGFLLIFVFASFVHAQDVPIVRVENESEVVIDWEALEFALEPLERIQLEPPTLSTGENGEKQYWLYKGEDAPWNGVLLNPPAAAFILSEYEAVQQRATAALERQRSSDMNRLHLEVGRLHIQLESDRARADVQIEVLKREISRLEEVHQSLIDENSSNLLENFLKIGGGALVGIAAGVLVGFLLVK